MDYALVAVTVFTALMALLDAVRPGRDHLLWELRWRALTTDDRARIATAARSGTKLELPEETKLAAGFRRRDRRHEARLELRAIPLLVLLVAFALSGTLTIGAAIAAFTFVTAAVAFVGRRRSRAGAI